MGLTANFYNVGDNPKKMGKTLGDKLVTEETLTPYQEVSELTGTIIVEYQAALDNCNYCIMGGKRYFITDRTLMTGQRIQLTLKVDVLDTYQSQILNCDAVFDRSDTLNNCEIIDGVKRFQANQRIDYYNFSLQSPKGLTYPNDVILICSV